MSAADAPPMTGPDWERIELENRGLTIRTARLLGEGWTSRAYLVNSELVFRFPKRPEDWKELEREIEFLSYAGSKLSLPVPAYLHVAPESSAATCGYAVYRYLAGEQLDVSALNARNRAAAADALATFLHTLHDLQPTSQLSFLPSEDPRQLAEDYLAQAEQRIVPKLDPSDAIALRKQLEEYASIPGSFLFRPSVLHADFSADHILTKDDSIVGVIDFGDVCWGDPDYDFMYVDFGAAFAGEVAQRYGHPDLDLLRKKLDYFAVIDQISTIVEGAGRALKGQEEQAWIRLIQFLRRSNRGGSG
jgi:aminoglycoside 2''-phosphotransferase